MTSSDTAGLERAVLAALGSLYQVHGSNVHEMQAADSFLRGFQLTPAAFDICMSLLDQILQNSITQPNSGSLDSNNVPPVFFAAQTLAIKLRRRLSTSELDDGAWVKRIVTWLSCGIRLPKMVVTQLLLALVATLPKLKVQEFKPQAYNDIEKNASEFYAAVLETCAQCNGQSVVGYALLHMVQQRVPPAVFVEFLLLLVEEIDSLIDRGSRKRMQDEVDAWASVVLDRLLPQVMHEASNQQLGNCSDGVEIQNTVLRALTGWVRYVRINTDVVVRNPLLHSLLTFLSRDELFDASVDLAVQLVISYAHDAVVIQWLAPTLLSLRRAFSVAAEAEDVDTCLGLCRIFSEMGEACFGFIQTIGNYDVALVDLLLDCMSFSDAEVADVTIPFWLHMLGNLQHRNSATLERYQPQVMRLAGLCTQKLQFRDDFLSLPGDQQQNFKDFRQEIGDILRDCCQLLGVETILQHCVNGLNLVFQAPLDSRKWEAVEAHLYCFRSIAREVEKSNTNTETLNASISLIFQHLTQFADHPAICYTACLIVSRYAKWLHAHPTVLSPLVGFLTTCVTKSAEISSYKDWEVARAAGAAVRALAIDCWLMLGQDIVAFYLQIEQTEVMAVEDQVLILEGICIGVSSVKDRDCLLTVLDQVMKGIGQRLTALFSSSAATEQVDIALDELLRLICLYEYLDSPDIQGERHPLVMLTEQLWPLFNQILTVYRGHDELVERVCRCYKRILRTCALQIAPLLPQLVDNLLMFYQAEPKSSYLYTASMVLKFTADSNSTDLNSLFARMIYTLIEKTTPIFASVNDMEAHPDVIEEFFYLMERAIRCVPLLLAASVPMSSSDPQCPLLINILSCAVSALSISHNDANKAVLCFLEQVYEQSEARIKLLSLCELNMAVHEGGKKKLVSCLLEGIVLGTMSPSRVDAEHGSIAGLFVCLATANGSQLQQWITEWFEQATVGTFATAKVNFLTLDEALAFRNDLFSSENERTFRRTIRHFGKLCASRNTSLTDCGRFNTRSRVVHPKFIPLALWYTHFSFDGSINGPLLMKARSSGWAGKIHRNFPVDYTLDGFLAKVVSSRHS
ncbi:putative armadillo-like helical, exportin-1/Importin-beta [Plasmopara halstedii]